MNFVRIEGYPYVIHPCGTVLRLWKGYTKEMKPYKRKDGYITINLHKNGKPKSFQLHRLLGLAFIPNPEHKPTIDHINRIKDDNDLSNLRWATDKEQSANRIRPQKDITPGNIYKTKCGYQWKYFMKGKRKGKSMKNLKDLEKYRDEILSNYL